MLRKLIERYAQYPLLLFHLALCIILRPNYFFQHEYYRWAYIANTKITWNSTNKNVILFLTLEFEILNRYFIEYSNTGWLFILHQKTFVYEEFISYHKNHFQTEIKNYTIKNVFMCLMRKKCWKELIDAIWRLVNNIDFSIIINWNNQKLTINCSVILIHDISLSSSIRYII